MVPKFTWGWPAPRKVAVNSYAQAAVFGALGLQSIVFFRTDVTSQKVGVLIETCFDFAIKVLRAAPGLFCVDPRGLREIGKFELLPP